MKSLKKVLSFSVAAAFGILLSACASKGVSEKEARYYLVSDEDALSLVSNGVVANPENKDGVVIKPGVIYLTEEMQEIFKLENVHAETNEYGLLTTRIYGENLNLGFFTWLVHGENPYVIGYRFIWFDANGNIIDNGARDVYTFGRRESMPGDPVRYSGIAKTEDGKDFAFALTILKNPYTMSGCMSDEVSFLPPTAAAKKEEAEEVAAEAAEKAEKKAKENAPAPAVSAEQQNDAARITGDVSPESKLPSGQVKEDTSKPDIAGSSPVPETISDKVLDPEPVTGEPAPVADKAADEANVAPAAEEVKAEPAPAAEQEKKAPAAPKFEEEYNYLKN